MNPFFEINFTGTDEIMRLADQRLQFLVQNVQTAIVRTTLYGIAVIANDCPVDTGRLRASIAGKYAGMAGVDLPRGHIMEGRQMSVTNIDLKKAEGTIGTNVEYAVYVEYGHRTGGRRKLTPKQIAYLIATGVLVPDGRGGLMASNIHNRINRRAGISGGRAKGRGFFRKNIPLIERRLQKEMDDAIRATSEGLLLRAEGF